MTGMEGIRPQRYEAPPADRGSGSSRPPQRTEIVRLDWDSLQPPPNEAIRRVLTPTDKEYQRYSELLQVFFEKMARWQEIAQTKGKVEGHTPNIHAYISVFHAGDARVLVPGTSATDKFNTENDPHPQDRILELSSLGYFDFKVDKNGLRLDSATVNMFINPGLAGRQLLVDPEGIPLDSVYIYTYKGKNPDWSPNPESEENKVYTGFSMSADYPSTQPPRLRPAVKCHYKLHEPTKVLKIDDLSMAETYQTHLINTIDTLIPNPAR